VEAVTAEPWPSGKLDHVHERLRAAEAVSKRRRFEGLLERHEARLRRVAFGVLGDANRVDDVLQEALLKAYRALPTRFESDHQEAAWLYRIVHRSCLNELRSRRRRPETLGVPDVAAHATDDATLASIAVAAALAELPPDARAVVLLVDLIGLDYETAAAALRIPRGTVASRLSAARSLLRAAFARQEGGGDV
jgi:RNA polymerase sigma-70 factor, ECF subfamily